MQIVSASYNEFGSINVVVEDMPEGSAITVPADPANMDYVELQAWVSAGNTIAPYVAPPPDPDEVRKAAIVALPKVARLKTLLSTATGDEIDDWADDNAGSAAELRTAFKTLLKLLAVKL
jgi:hypothetical protein